MLRRISTPNKGVQLCGYGSALIQKRAAWKVSTKFLPSAIFSLQAKLVQINIGTSAAQDVPQMEVINGLQWSAPADVAAEEVQVMNSEDLFALVQVQYCEPTQQQDQSKYQKRYAWPLEVVVCCRSSYRAPDVSDTDKDDATES